MTDTVEPLSNTTQIAMRIPVVLLALIGIVLALVLIRRLGPASGLLGAAGLLFVVLDQAANIAWVLHIDSLVKDDDFDRLQTVANTYTIADATLITIAVALLVAALAVRRTAKPQPAPFGQPPAYAQAPGQQAQPAPWTQPAPPSPWNQPQPGQAQPGQQGPQGQPPSGRL